MNSSDVQIDKENGVVGRRVHRFLHLEEMLEEVAILPAPHAFTEYLRVFDLAEEFGRQQDIVNLL